MIARKTELSALGSQFRPLLKRLGAIAVEVVTATVAVIVLLSLLRGTINSARGARETVTLEKSKRLAEMRDAFAGQGSAKAYQDGDLDTD